MHCAFMIGTLKEVSWVEVSLVSVLTRLPAVWVEADSRQRQESLSHRVQIHSWETHPPVQRVLDAVSSATRCSGHETDLCRN